MHAKGAINPLGHDLSSFLWLQCAASVPVFVEPDALCHLRAHETRVYDAHCDTPVLEVEGELLPHHVKGSFRAMMSEIPATFLLVAEGDRAALGGDEDYFGSFCKDGRADERVYDEDGRNGGCCVHSDFGVPVRTFGEVFSCEVAGRDIHSIYRGGIQGG